MSYWSGAIDDKWSNPLNWYEGVVPTVGDYVSVYGPNPLDIDVDVNVGYISIGNNAPSVKFNNRTIQCTTEFYDDTSASNVIDSGTSTIIIGSSATSAIDDWADIQLKYAILDKVITYGNANFTRPAPNIFKPNETYQARIKTSLVCHTKLYIYSYNQPVYIDCPFIDLRNCVIVENYNLVKYFKVGTTILARNNIIDSTGFILFASANNQIIDMPSETPYKDISDGAYILSPYDENTNTYYSNVTFRFPSEIKYGMFFDKPHELVQGSGVGSENSHSTLMCCSATVDFQTNNTSVYLSMLDLSACTLLYPNSDLNLCDGIRINSGTINNPNSKGIILSAYKREILDPSSIFKVYSNIRLPYINSYYKAVRGNFIGSSLTSNFETDILKIDKQSTQFSFDANLSGNFILNDFAGSLYLCNISANSITLNGSEFYYSEIHYTTFTQTSGSTIKNCMFSTSNAAATGAPISASNCFNMTGLSNPTNILLDYTVITTTWNNSAGTNVWETAGNWSNGLPSLTKMAVFNGSVTSATCNINSNTSALGISARGVGNALYMGAVNFANNSSLQLTRICQLSQITKLSAANLNQSQIILKNNTGNKIFYSNGGGDNAHVIGGIDVYSDVLSNWYNSVSLIAKRVNIYNCKLMGQPFCTVGNPSTTDGSLNIYSNLAYLGCPISMLNTTSINLNSTNDNVLLSDIAFVNKDQLSLTIPNKPYKGYISLGLDDDSTIAKCTFAFENGTQPSFNTLQFAALHTDVDVDLTNITNIGTLPGGGMTNSNCTYRTLFADSIVNASTPIGFSYDYIIAVSQPNTILNMTRDYEIPGLNKRSDFNIASSLASSTNTLISGTDKTFIIYGRGFVKSLSAIGCNIKTPYNSYLNVADSYTPAIIATGEILLSGCTTDNPQMISNAQWYYGYQQYFEASSVVLSASKITLNSTDLISYAWNSSAYSNVTPSAINCSLRNSTATVSGNAKAAIDLGGNINWKFSSAIITSIIPSSGTTWNHIVTLSGTNLNDDNIYFDGTLVTDYISRTDTSASVAIPIKDPGSYNFAVG